MRRLRAAAVGLVLILLSLPAASLGQGADAYRLGPRDLLEIKVLEDDSLNITPRVSDSGTIELPPAGQIPVEGLTTNEATLAIQQALERFLRRATVSIEIVEYRSSPISVLGEVNNPGHLPFSGRWNLLQAITQAGGLTDKAGGTIFVLRRSANGLSDQLAISTHDLMVRNDQTVNIPVFANDWINVPPAVDITISCLGAFRNQGSHVFRAREDVTLIVAIARAGGLTDEAADKITIKRSGSEDLVVSYKRIISGKDPNPALQDGDILYVKESFF